MEFLPRFGPSDVVNASGSMPFRLLSASPARCGAVTRSGAQCAINAGSSLRDGSGKLVSEPLRRGGPHCMFHMSLFETKAAAVCGDVLVFYIDFETTGLDVLAAEVLEIGVTEARSLSHKCARACNAVSACARSCRAHSSPQRCCRRRSLTARGCMASTLRSSSRARASMQRLPASLVSSRPSLAHPLRRRKAAMMRPNRLVCPLSGSRRPVSFLQRTMGFVTTSRCSFPNACVTAAMHGSWRIGSMWTRCKSSAAAGSMWVMDVHVCSACRVFAAVAGAKRTAPSTTPLRAETSSATSLSTWA